MAKRRNIDATGQSPGSAAPDVDQPSGQFPVAELVYADALNQKLKDVEQTAGYCGLCAGVLRSFVSHTPKRPSCNNHSKTRRLTPDEWHTLKKEI